MKFVVMLVVSVIVVQSVGGQQGKRRRIKKKIARQNEEENLMEEKPEQATETNLANHKLETGENLEKAGRGFLDDYYKQFESRTESVHLPGVDQAAEESASLPRFNQNQFQPSTGKLASAERRRDQEDQQLEQLLAKEAQLQELLAREAELSPDQREELLRQLSHWPQQQPSVQPLSQDSYPDYSYDQYKDISEPVNNQLTSLHNDEAPRIKKHSSYSDYISEVIPGSLTDNIYATAEPSSKDGDLEDRATYQTSSATKYFGLTGTTSQDIQLGLTFTVPFLSIPLNAINSIIGGNFGDIGNLFNFNNLDVGSLATVAVIGIAAIFILPQAVYWLTGINLSSFNWGRSDDDVGASGMVHLANTVDTALQEFNIDGKGCVARTMCTTLYDKEEKSDSIIVKSIASSAINNPTMMAYLGEARSKMLQEFGTISEKYGAQPGSCNTVFKTTCPWDTAGLTSIVMKLMASQGTSLAELALKAASVAAKA